MKTTKKKNLVLLIGAFAFIVGMAITVYAYPPYPLDDTTGPMEWGAYGKKKAQDLKAEGKVKPRNFRLVMKSLGPDVSAILVALMTGDREAIPKLTRRFLSPPYLIPKTKNKFVPRPADKIEFGSYGLETHYLASQLGEAAKDPNIEMRVLMWNFNAMLGRCIRCHDRFKD